MKSTLYVLGNTVLFALLGWWAGSRSAVSPMWGALLGATLGYVMGISFRPARNGGAEASRTKR